MSLRWSAGEGEYASTSDYVRDLVRRDRERRSHPELTMDDLRQIVDESRASGVGEISVSDILDQAKKHAKASGHLNEWICPISETLEIGDRIVVLKRPATIAYDVSFDAGTGQQERELIRARIGDVLAA